MCTTMIITPGASADGSMMVTHSDDDSLSDQRIIYVPAQDHPAGAMRQVMAESYRYPRIVTDQRGPGYMNPDPKLYHKTIPIGKIPQVSHTYAYFDGNYGIMNEYNLLIGECTDGAKYQPGYVTKEEAEKEDKHERIFYSSELSRVALERCKTAQEAIRLMGKLIDEYGYYSSGETLLVGDETEAWVFEMCALPNEGDYHSAWVAQKVPDGDLFIAANEFRIRVIPEKKDPDFIYPDNLFDRLEAAGWWKKADGPMDWLPTVSPGEYFHPYYSLRRVWRVFDRVNPDLGLNPWVKDGYTTDYPFSVRPKRKLQLCDVFALYRDHYEGTQFDMTKGAAAGPYGVPYRFTGTYDGALMGGTGFSGYDVTPFKAAGPYGYQDKVLSSDKQKLYGAWERPISFHDQGYTYVCQVRPKKPEATKGLCWFGPDIAYTTCFTPFPSKVADLPGAYQTGNPQKFDWDTAWWVFDFVANWARLNFQRMTKVDIQPLQEELELMQLKLIGKWDSEVQGKSKSDGIKKVTDLCKKNSKEVLKKWMELAYKLIAKYSDGYINLTDAELKGVSDPKTDLAAISIGYPSTWLSHTNYKDGPTTYDIKP